MSLDCLFPNHEIIKTCGGDNMLVPVSYMRCSLLSLFTLRKIL